ncbi:MAG: glycosyltransferase family 2 protein [Bacteroidota bacterium]
MNGLRRNDAEVLDTAGTSNSPLVAIVILNWNGRAYLQQFLPFVLASTYANKRIVVADNASTDDSLSVLAAEFPQVEIIVNPGNEGFARGYNLALRQVTADYYVLLNSDVEVSPGWIEPVINMMQENINIGACQPKLLSYHNREEFEYAGAAGGWIDNFGYPFARGRVFDSIEKDIGQYNAPAQCFWASGAAFFVRANLYHEVGGLDEYFFAHQEEIDLCWRLQLDGHAIYAVPASVVYHVGGGTLNKESAYKSFLNFRNNLVMCAKNYPSSTAIWKIPVRLMLDAVAAWKGLAEGKPGFFVAVCKAHVYFVKWLLLEKNKSVFPASRRGDLGGVYKGSIVWHYFIKKQKAFSEIIKGK